MNRQSFTIVVCATVCTVLQPATAHADSDIQVADLGTQVRGLFKEKCAECHGPDLAKPRGHFGYVLDLPRITSNPKMVIPGKSEDSKLWLMVKSNKMPPANSPQGPLNAEEKETIRSWVEAGAPAPMTPVSDSDSIKNPSTTVSGETSVHRALGDIGEFHLLLLLFPIVLVFAAGVCEGWSRWRHRPLPSRATRLCLWLAAAAAIPTAVTGWLYAAAGNGAGWPRLLMAHRWCGTSAALCIVVTAIISERDVRRAQRSRLVLILMSAVVVIVIVTANLGGLLAWGMDLFDSRP